MEKKTHREVKQPRISARYLADYMAASETTRRTILRNSKYPPIARIVQHVRAKTAISGFLCGVASTDTSDLSARASQWREMMADDEFGRLTLDHNADYLDCFVSVAPDLDMPNAERLAPGPTTPIMLEEVRVAPELHFRLRRTAQNNKVRVGGGMLRYAKNRPLLPEVGKWQSALLAGYLTMTNADAAATTENKLCLTIDAVTGEIYCAPGDAASRFKNMKAACASIAERWDNIKPPPGAII